MKKRFSLIGLLCGILILSMLCGCGSKDQITDNTIVSENAVTEVSTTENLTSDNVFTKRFVEDFSDGYAWITLSNESRNFYKFVCINDKGEIQFVLNDLIDIEYSNGIGNFKDGYAVVVDKSEVTYIIDTTGKIISSNKDGVYDKVICYDDGYFLVEKCNNNLHEVSYAYSIIDGKGNILIKDWFISNNQNSTFKYRGDSVFSYVSTREYDFECINVKSQKRFKLERVKTFYCYNENKTFLLGEFWRGTNQIIDNEGNKVQLDLDDYRVGTDYNNKPIVNNSIICYKSNDDSLYKLDVNTGEVRELYHCGNGISAGVVDYNNESILLNVKDNQGKNWVVLIDYQGNDLLTPFEGEPVSLSCDRIITHLPKTGTKKYIYDLKGNQISFDDKTYSISSSRFNSDLICVSIKVDSDTTRQSNYIDINGKLLFPDN